jgi:hypothetical protein
MPARLLVLTASGSQILSCFLAVDKTALLEIWTDSQASSKMMLFVGGLPHKAACLTEQKQSLGDTSEVLTRPRNRIIFWRK